MNEKISLTDVEKAASAMRAHWGIENNLHRVLEDILNEDYCLVRKDNAAVNLSVLRKIVLNIMGQLDFSDIIKAKKMFLSLDIIPNDKYAERYENIPQIFYYYGYSSDRYSIDIVFRVDTVFHTGG